MPLQTLFSRTIASCLMLMFLVASCKNNGSSDGGNPVNNSYLASVRTIAEDEIAVDSFVYDDKKRIATCLIVTCIVTMTASRIFTC